MTVQENMEHDFFDLLSKLIIENDSDTPYRLAKQEEALNELTCSQPRLGKWIECCDYPFLMDTLTLDSTTFAEEFPSLKVTESERAQFVAVLKAHGEECPRCHLKIGYDLEWEARVDKTLVENKQVISKALAHAAK